MKPGDLKDFEFEETMAEFWLIASMLWSERNAFGKVLCLPLWLGFSMFIAIEFASDLARLLGILTSK